jgi:hypothetical protein
VERHRAAALEPPRLTGFCSGATDEDEEIEQAGGSTEAPRPP